MTYFVAELAGWTLGAWFAGCLIGAGLRGLHKKIRHPGESRDPPLN